MTWLERLALLTVDLSRDVSHSTARSAIQTTNLIATEPAVANDLFQTMKDWRKKTNAPIPIKPNPNDVDVVIEKPNKKFIGRLFDKIENSNVRVRTYENPNNVPNNNRIRNYNRVENNSNNNIIRNNNNSRPSRTYTPPTRSSSPPVVYRGSSNGRSSGGAVISRGSRGNNN